ncbi:MAG: hypothetical protein M1812_005240 [Candelaria pacifica]|nr:MAG: hypothetical protein M1812_005240 [Candelaria pacifica]
MVSPAKEPPLRGLFKTIVKVHVGPQKQSFDVHEELLCHVSPFFQAALEGHFKEATTQVVELPEDSPDTFQYFIQWLYRLDLSHEAHDGGNPRFTQLHRLYVLADKLQIKALKNLITDHVLAVSDRSNLLPTDTAEAFSELPEGGLRELALDLFLWFAGEDFNPKKFDREFLEELVMRTMREIRGVLKGDVSCLHEACRYHEHTVDGVNECDARKGQRPSKAAKPATS